MDPYSLQLPQIKSEAIYQVSQQVLERNVDISNWHNWPYKIVLFWMGDGAARHRSVLPSTEPCRVMTHHSKTVQICQKEQNTVIDVFLL